MNNKRREVLRGVIGKLEDCRSTVESIMDEEQDCFDNLPENFQSYTTGEKMEEAISNLEDAASKIEEAISSVEAAME